MMSTDNNTSASSSYNEALFRRQVESALQNARTVLDAELFPTFFDRQNFPHHSYDDKFAVAELLAHTAVAAQCNAWEAMGLGPEHVRTVLEWHHVQKRPVTLRFAAHDSCTFLKEIEVDVTTSPTFAVETTTTSTETANDPTTTTEPVGPGSGATTTHTETTVVSFTRTIREYHWTVEVEYGLIVYPGNTPEEGIVLHRRQAETVLVTQQHQNGPAPPIFPSTAHAPVDVSLAWFLQQIDNEYSSISSANINAATSLSTCVGNRITFAIDRDDVANTKTPRRNAQVEAALQAHQELREWSRRVRIYFCERVERDILRLHQPTHSVTTPASPSLTTIVDDNVLVPILPLATMENEGTGAGVAVLTSDNVSVLVQEQKRSLDAALRELVRTYPSLSTTTATGQQQHHLVSVAEASLCLICRHVDRLCSMLTDGMDHLEHLLEDQLLAAIGRSIGSADFDKYMTYHYPRHLFGGHYAPVPFCRAIRQSGDHFPDGMMAIEKMMTTTTTFGFGFGGGSEPISTFVRIVPGTSSHGSSGNPPLLPPPPPPVRIPIHAAAAVEITGDRYLHGWMLHQFAGAPTFTSTSSPVQQRYQLACRARQFSSFLVVLGTLVGPDSLDVKQAIIVQNKDEVLIPLILTPLPSAKAFHDAIQSLSPEQQEFATAFRAMQLSTSVFAVCVIQLKPQLEKLLQLPSGSLTKEIKLTQDLMTLFIDYQIPSDMLTYDGAADCSAAEKLAAVQGHVQSVMDVIVECKTQQLKEEEQRADMRTEVGMGGGGGLFGAPAPHTGFACSSAKSTPFSFASTCGFGSTGFAAPSSFGSTTYSTPFGGPSTCGGGLFGAPLPGPPAFGAAHVGAAVATSTSAFGAPLSGPPAFGAAPVGAAAASTTSTLFGTNAASATTSDHHANVQNPWPEPVKADGPADATGEATVASSDDFTLIPQLLDERLKELDSDGALRSTTIQPSNDQWSRRRQDNLLLPPKSNILTRDDLARETKRALDLLDCLSRCGTLPIASAELHVLIAVSHCFDKACVQTIVQDNINPIAKVERSALLVAATIFGQSDPAALLKHNAREDTAGRLRVVFPELFEASKSTE